MSARDAESGSSTYKGGSGYAGGLGNGGIGGGMGGGGNWGGGGGMGGGAGRNGGIGNRTGLTTGNRMYGNVAWGRPGGRAMNPGAWGVRPQPSVMQGPLSGMPRQRVPGVVPGVNPIRQAQTYPAVNAELSLPTYEPAFDPYAITDDMVPSPTSAPPPPAPVNSAYPAYQGFKNPTAYPQWAGGWKYQTDDYRVNNMYPGGYSYTTPGGTSYAPTNSAMRQSMDSAYNSVPR